MAFQSQRAVKPVLRPAPDVPKWNFLQEKFALFLRALYAIYLCTNLYQIYLFSTGHIQYGSTTFDRRHLTAGRLAAGQLTVRHLTPSRFYRRQLTAKKVKERI